ncbi:MAG: hypothetical protein ACLTSS_04860 [Phocaeicola coprocola]
MQIYEGKRTRASQGKSTEEFSTGKTDFAGVVCLSLETGAEYFDVALTNNEYQITSAEHLLLIRESDFRKKGIRR